MAHVFVTGMAVQDFVFQLDDLPVGGEKFTARAVSIAGGGCAANAAVAVTRLGGQANLAARLGQDDIGDMIVAELMAEGVNLDCIHRSPTARSGFSSIYVDQHGERQIVNFRGAGLMDDPGFVTLPDTVDAALADSRWVAGAARTMQITKARDIPGIVDAEAPVGLDQMAQASHIAFSRRGLLDVTGEADLATALKVVSAAVPAWVCVTDGPDGVYFMDGQHVENLPAYPVTPIDTLGAGDIWHGAFALRLAEGAHEHAAMEFANAAAALKCCHFGGRQTCPNRAETEALRSGKPRPGRSGPG